MEDILNGFLVFTDVSMFALLVAGLLGGFVAGALPGFSSSNAAALVLPFTLGLGLEPALVLITGVYAGAAFAGSVPAVLMNVPGTAGAAATALDGYQMARQGRAGEAISIARTASVVGGVVAGLIVLFAIGPLSSVALNFGAREMVAVSVFGLLVIVAVLGTSITRGLIVAALGLLIAAMSADPLTSSPRLTFGFLELYEGVPLVPVIIGLFGFTQMFLIVRQDTFQDMSSGQEPPRVAMWDGVSAGVLQTLRRPKVLFSSTFLGLILGVIPGIGTAVSNFVAYGVAKRSSKHPERFGKGSEEGVIASEACDNAVTAGSLAPTLALGVPGSSTAAIMLAAITLSGVQPGPTIIATQPTVVYAIVVGLIIASALILPIGLLVTAPLAMLTRVPPRLLVPPILMLCVLGAYAVRQSVFDVALAAAFGLLGVAMRLTGLPIPPLVIAIILGPILEGNLARARALGNDSIGYFVGSTTSKGLWLLILAVVAFSAVRSLLQRRSSGRSPAMSQQESV